MYLPILASVRWVTPNHALGSSERTRARSTGTVRPRTPASACMGCANSKPIDVKPSHGSAQPPTDKGGMPTKRAALIVIDGWGYREEEYGNCIK